MTIVKTIKGIDENAWLEFKSLAAKNKMRTGKFFEKLVEGYKNRADSAWDKILNAGKILSDKEADDIEEFVKKLRKERGFRN